MKTTIDIIILSYFVAVNLLYTTLIVLGLVEVARRKLVQLPELDEQVLTEAGTPPISLLVPAHNEEENICESVRAFLQLRYPELHVIVVDDGSTDETFERLDERFDLAPHDMVVRRQIETREIHGIYQSRKDERLLVVDKENGGKSDALNAALNLSRTPLVASVDADTIVERDALLRMVEPFLYDPEGVSAVGGTVRIANGCTVEDGLVTEVDAPDSWLARFQIVEYLRGFLFGRMGFNYLGGNLIISGAFGMFSRRALLDVGGYDTSTVGEDMEVVVALQRRHHDEDGGKVIHIPEPICYTEVPEHVRTLGRQRDRWHRGLAETLWRHKGAMLNPRYGSLGLVLFPIFLLFELLGPLVELFGYIWFLVAVIGGFVNWWFALLFVTVALVWGGLLSLQSLVLDWWSFDILHNSKVRRKLTVAALLENLGFRQLTLLFRIRGLLRAPFTRGEWGEMERHGLSRDRRGPTEEASSSEAAGATGS